MHGTMSFKEKNILVFSYLGLRGIKENGTGRNCIM